MERTSASQKFPIGSKMPSFSLPSTDDTQISNSYFKDARLALVAFTCNHCPYVKGSEEMFISTVKQYQADGLRTVAISSNDAVQYPEDSLQKMREKSRLMNLPYPYLYDESQAVAKLFDAECTPEFFLFDKDGLLVYHGTINDCPRDATKASKNYLATAITQALEGVKPDPAFIHPLGCSIKWKI